MTHRMVAIALAAALAAGCGAASQESRRGGEESARRERGGESARGKRRGERAQEQGGGAQAGVAPRGKQPRVPATPEALLGRDTVAKVQQALAERRLLGPHRQGELDQPTREAVRRFQRQQGLAATGVPDRETLEDLGVNSDQAYGPRHGGKG